MLVVMVIVGWALSWAYAGTFLVVFSVIRYLQRLEIFADHVVIKATSKRVVPKADITGLERGHVLRGGTYILTADKRYWSVVPSGTWLGRPTAAELDELWTAIKS